MPEVKLLPATLDRSPNRLRCSLAREMLGMIEREDMRLAQLRRRCRAAVEKHGRNVEFSR